MKGMALGRFCQQKVSVLLLAKSRMSTAASEVIFQEYGNKGVITLNRPGVLNALNLNMIRLMYSKLKEWEISKTCIIVKGAGEKAYCAGGDIIAIREAGLQGGSLTKEFFKEEYILNCLIGTYQVPYIALLNGITMGGGVGVSVHGKYRVATEKALFAMPETAIGFFPDVGGSYFLPRLGGELGTYIALTGHRLKGTDVQKAGIATHMCNSSELGNLEEALLKLDSGYPEDIGAVLAKYHDMSSLKDKEFSLKPYLSQISQCFSASSVEGILDSLEKEGSEWSKRLISTIRKMSPASTKVTFEEIRRGGHLSMQDCFQMEYRISQRFMEEKDFYEGVRAQLITKDQSPRWNPSTLEDVTQEYVESYFKPLPDDVELKF